MIQTVLIEAGISFLILTPFYLFAKRSESSTDTKKVLLAMLVYLLTHITISVLNISLFEGQRWNWAGKGAAFILALLFAFIVSGFKPGKFGLTLTIKHSGAKPILLVCFIYLIIRLGLYFILVNDKGGFNAEAILFQATLPGLQEELVYRGILLGLLNSVFITSTWTLFKVIFGWAAILTSLLFGLSHGINVTENFGIHFNYFAFLRTAFDGMLFALLAEKTKSIFPGILFHNLLNLVGNH